jgi:UDPglucose 6-dehydrogenase
MKNKYDTPLFCGLTHLGQVFSIGWNLKFGSSSVFDFNKKNFQNFKNNNLTQEEPELKKNFRLNKKNFFFININEIKKYKNVFFTEDTPIEKKKIDFVFIKNKIKKLKNYLGRNANLIICSQVHVGFCDDIKKEIFFDRQDINIIYFAETLIMGEAIKRFLYPERIILGVDKESDFINIFNKFKCPVLVYNYKQAEMVKMAVNLYLATNVTFANTIDEYCRQYGFKFSSINLALKYDNRIGLKSYLNPSLGLSGGHLERDLKTIISNSKSKNTLSFFKKIFFYQKIRKKLLPEYVENLFKIKKVKRIVWLGISYKQNSLSLYNSPFLNCVNHSVKKKINFYWYDSYFTLKKSNINKFLKNLKYIKKNNSNNLYIFNYLSKKDYKSLERILKSEKNYILNLNKDNNFIKSSNVENLF